MKNIIVIGGGASGMMAAITAARNGAAVTVLEENSRPLKKLLATGNGRCNLTNLLWEGDVLRGSESQKAYEIIKHFDHKDVMRFFAEIGIPVKDRKGWVYPCNDSAAAAAKALIAEAESLKVKIKTNQKVLSVEKCADGSFEVLVDGWTYTADAVIIAVGSGASVKEEGYKLAERTALRYGIKYNKLLPALTLLKTPGKMKWAGVRTEGMITIFADDEPAGRSRGELQLTESGISGIPVFQVSRYASEALSFGRRVTVSIDFLPDRSDEEIISYVRSQKERYPGKTLRQIFGGMLPEKLAEQLISENKSIEENTENIRSCKLMISGTGDTGSSQICMGGIGLNELSEELEAHKVRGLYFTGEAADVDGTCGGYNLQWAWSSGWTAGKACSR